MTDRPIGAGPVAAQADAALSAMTDALEPGTALGVYLYGSAVTAPELLEAPPHTDVMRAMLEELPSLLADLDADTRNVLLTLARVWVTVETGQLRPKDSAADWAMERLSEPHRAILGQARDAYLGGEEPPWEPASVRSAANELVGRILEASTLPGQLA